MSDKYMFYVIGSGLAAYLIVVLIQGVTIARGWLKRRSAVREIDQGVIPADYDQVKAEQERINAVDSGGELVLNEKHAARSRNLNQVRLQTAHVRYAGYLRGEEDQHREVPFSDGLMANPNPRGSGAAKQWVRGYCMARNVTDIKQYYDAA